MSLQAQVMAHWGNQPEYCYSAVQRPLAHGAAELGVTLCKIIGPPADGKIHVHYCYAKPGDAAWTEQDLRIARALTIPGTSTCLEKLQLLRRATAMPDSVPDLQIPTDAMPLHWLTARAQAQMPALQPPAAAIQQINQAPQDAACRTADAPSAAL